VKPRLIVAAAIAAFAASASAQMGPGMMGGYGPGYGMGPGMMGGYGPGYGMGPGMMWGYGPCGPGAGGGIANLTSEQEEKIAKIEDDFSRRQWALMQSMQELRWGGAYGEGTFDEKAERKAFDAMAGLRKQMFDNTLEARKQIDAVLTKEQREQLRRGWGPRG